jgi:hypothetical protein
MRELGQRNVVTRSIRRVHFMLRYSELVRLQVDVTIYDEHCDNDDTRYCTAEIYGGNTYLYKNFRVV